MKSFDVFDTLIARRYITSDIIWHWMQSSAESLDYPNSHQFFTARKTADNGTRSLKQIYQLLVEQLIVSPQRAEELMQEEIKLEVSNIIPIQINLNRVEDGDILLSDTYLPGYIILQLVRSAGLDKQVTLYQSNSGKNTGQIWDAIKYNPPTSHLGDNQKSDVDQPRARGINAELTALSVLTDIETFLFEHNASHLALLVREIRLRNDIQKYSEFFSVANGLNLPWLFFTSEMLWRKHGNRDIVFLGRDCQLLHQIYSTFYRTSYYLPFSRQVAYTQSKDALGYLKAHSSADCVFVDISSTGGTWQHLNVLDAVDITVVIYSDIAYYTDSKPVLPPKFDYLTTNSESGQTNLYLELFNCGNHGYLESVQNLGGGAYKANFAKLDLDKELVDVLHTPTKDAVKLSSFYTSNLKAELAKLSEADLKRMFSLFVTNLCNQHQLKRYIPDFFAKEDTYLKKFITNE